MGTRLGGGGGGSSSGGGPPIGPLAESSPIGTHPNDPATSLKIVK